MGKLLIDATGAGTCGYTGLLATGNNSFIVTYSKWPNKNEKGENCKSIVAREITIN
jgi:hypothetical protein